MTLEDPLGLVGDTIAGRFRIDRKVAEGGFGIVYQAWQTILDRAVALKVLKTPTGLNGEQTLAFYKTFEVEARTIARLKHPHIVEVYDFGVAPRSTGGPLLWMALEWLEGNTLEEVLKNRTPMEPAQVLPYLRPVLEAIGYAHRRGVVHRDLKPSNIFLSESHGTIVPKVLDFGIAKILVGDEKEEQNTTRGSAAFSPDYAAPEQMLSTRTGPFTDVHALALIVTELLTGQMPYAGETDLFSAVLSERRPTPGTKGAAVGGWALSANVSETARPLKFTEQGEQGSHHDRDRDNVPRRGDRGAREGQATDVHRRVQAADREGGRGLQARRPRRAASA